MSMKDTTEGITTLHPAKCRHLSDVGFAVQADFGGAISMIVTTEANTGPAKI